MQVSRRSFLRLSGAGLMATQAPSIFSASHAAAPHEPGIPFQLGIASYTFREFSLEETIGMTRGLGIRKLCLKSMHMPLDLSAREIQSLAAKVNDSGIDLYGGGVIYMNTPEDVDRAFAYAANAGMDLIVGVPEHGLLSHCNKKVKETGIQLAIHNHGPGDKKYPSVASAYKLIKELDPGMGLCVDIGHTVRIGEDPIAETKKHMDRVLDIHIKDVDRADPSGESCEMGHGVIDLPGFLGMLIREGYSHVASFEYEKDGKEPLSGLAESVGYVRGILKMLSS